MEGEGKKAVEVVAALIWEGDRFLACQRPAHKDRGLLWEFPGGKVEPGETKAQALIRECQEELNITLAVGEPFMEMTHAYPDLTIHLTLLHSSVAEGTPQLLEHKAMRWVTTVEMDELPFCPADTVILDRLRSYDRRGDMLKEALFRVLEDHGAALMGIGDLSGIVQDEYTTGAAVAVPVPRNIVEDLKTAPTEEYYHMYYALNRKLDEIVEAGAAFLREKGYQARANTTKAVRTDETWTTPLPLKTVATRAGLGWIGKSNLLVTPAYGSAVRLSSLGTNAPLPVAEPISESRCGKCEQCVKLCPAHALTGTLWTAGMPRETLFRRIECYETQRFLMREHTGIETDLCGRCFAVCPHTLRYLKRG